MRGTDHKIEDALRGTLDMRRRFITHAYEEQEDVHCWFVHRKPSGDILFGVYLDNTDHLRIDRWRPTSFLDDLAIDTLICAR